MSEEQTIRAIMERVDSAAVTYASTEADTLKRAIGEAFTNAIVTEAGEFQIDLNFLASYLQLAFMRGAESAVESLKEVAG